VIGVTGNIACGKSLVLEELRRLGAETIDADRVAHGVMEPGSEAYAGIVAHFGRDVLGADGGIDRRRLGAIVFRDPAELAALDGGRRQVPNTWTS
jgi:dephospho-CoA kinase